MRESDRISVLVGILRGELLIVDVEAEQDYVILPCPSKPPGKSSSFATLFLARIGFIICIVADAEAPHGDADSGVDSLVSKLWMTQGRVLGELFGVPGADPSARVATISRFDEFEPTVGQKLYERSPYIRFI